MRALTIRQPWATLIALGVKTIETRSWRAPRSLIGQTIAIHAGKHQPEPGHVGEWCIDRNRRDGAWMRRHTLDPSQRLPLGAIVATATLADCRPAGHIHLSELPSETERRSVPNWPGYEVTINGDVWTAAWHRLGAIRLNPRPDGQGYPHLVLRRPDGSRSSVRIHSMVAEAWLSPVEATTLVRHVNGNRFDCSAWNLRRGTHSDNLRDAFALGERPSGEARSDAKFTSSEVAYIRRLRADGAPQENLAVRFGCSLSTIQRIEKMEHYRVDEPTQPDDSLALARWAWLLTDVKPTTERCPACLGQKYWLANGDETAPEIHCETSCRQPGSYFSRGKCPPIPAKGKQGLWTWQP